MKTLETNPNGSPHPNSLMLPTWYPISTLLWIKTQRVKSRNNSYIGVTQENSIEFLIQSSLPYILLPMVCASYCAPYPKWPWVWHEASMCCPCCMTSLCSRTFYFLLPSPVISLVTDVTVWLINPNPSCSKNRKMKKKTKRKVK